MRRRFDSEQGNIYGEETQVEYVFDNDMNPVPPEQPEAVIDTEESVDAVQFAAMMLPWSSQVANGNCQAATADGA